MRGARASMNLLRSFVRNSGAPCDGVVTGGSDLVSSLLRITAAQDSHWLHRPILSSRSFASDADNSSSRTDEVSPGEEPPDKNMETISRWFLPKNAKGFTEQEREEITGKEVGARWLASSKENSSTEQELSDLSSVPWFGLNKETPASERERLEVSMQRLALMSKLGDNNHASNFMFLPPKNELLRKYFHWENLSSPEKHKVVLTKVRQQFQIHKTDCGSSQVQVALLTEKIKYMTKHMETHRKDYHSRKGLEAMVQRRRKILKYLRRKDWAAYCDVITKLGLRDNVMGPQKR